MKSVLLIPILVFMAGQAWGWGDIGHGAVGYVAEKNLTPQAKRLVYNIIGLESLAVAAVWPDQVRSDERFSKNYPFGNFHFFEIQEPYKFEDMTLERRAREDAHFIIENAQALLSNSQLKREQKMIALRYLVHVIGDVHQPFHVGNGLDMGANLCKVTWKNPENGLIVRTNLHTAWDEKIIENIGHEFQLANPPKFEGQKRWFGYREMGDIVIAELEKSENFKKISSAQFNEWYNETQKLHSYPDGSTKLTPKTRPYCEYVEGVGKDRKYKKPENYDPKAAPLLDDNYINAGKPVIKRQILLAGYRLAGILNHIAEDMKLADWTDKDEKDLLEGVLLKMKNPRSVGKNKDSNSNRSPANSPMIKSKGSSYSYDYPACEHAH